MHLNTGTCKIIQSDVIFYIKRINLYNMLCCQDTNDDCEDEVMTNASINLREEILILREKLDNLLDDKPLTCTEAQEISVKLDKLIAKYYLQKGYKTNTNQ